VVHQLGKRRGYRGAPRKHQVGTPGRYLGRKVRKSAIIRTLLDVLLLWGDQRRGPPVLTKSRVATRFCWGGATWRSSGTDPTRKKEKICDNTYGKKQTKTLVVSKETKNRGTGMKEQEIRWGRPQKPPRHKCFEMRGGGRDQENTQRTWSLRQNENWER